MKVQLNVTRDTMVDCESKRFNQWLIVASQKYNGWGQPQIQWLAEKGYAAVRLS